MKPALFVALVALSGLPLGAQTSPEPESLPSWVLYGLGQQAVEEGRPGEAVVLFRQAIDRRVVFPEAEGALAKIAAQGTGTAYREALLLKALDQRGLLQVPDDRYALLYALADLRLQADTGKTVEKGEAALETWREILSEDRVYRSVEESGGLEGYYRALFDQPSPVTFKTGTGPSTSASLVGLNKLLYLYRHPLGFSLRAHQEIAAVSVTNKAYRKAIGHSLFALTGILSTVLAEVETLYPDYTFRSLDELFVDPRSPVYLGRPEGILETGRGAGAPNPGTLVRHRPIWDYLDRSDTLGSLNTLLAALDGLAAQERASGVPAGQRSIREIRSEIQRWRQVLFPDSAEAKARTHG